MVSSLASACVEWAAAKTAAPGSTESGDACCLIPSPHRLLAAVLDGLGHGPAAAAAARLGTAALERARSTDLVALVHECHARLRGSRGAVMSLAVFDERLDTMTWMGVGNVSGSHWSPQRSLRHTLIMRSGVVGTTLPMLKVETVSVARGDMVILSTDGVTGEVGPQALQEYTLQAVADRVLSRCSSGLDDALVLVLRYRGAIP